MNKKEFMRYVRFFKDVADGYGITILLAWISFFGGLYAFAILVGAFI